MIYPKDTIFITDNCHRNNHGIQIPVQIYISIQDFHRQVIVKSPSGFMSDKNLLHV